MARIEISGDGIKRPSFVDKKIYHNIIQEGAHLYVKKELQPHLNEFKRNNPKEDIVYFHVGEPSELPLSSALKEGSILHTKAYLTQTTNNILDKIFKGKVRLNEEKSKKAFGYQSNKGLEEVAEAWAGHLTRAKIYGTTEVLPEWIQLGMSGKMYAILLGQVLQQDGVDAVIPAPMYPGHASLALEYTKANKEPRKHGIHGIPVTKEKHWQNDPDQTAEILNESLNKSKKSTSILVINCNPQNPTGGVSTDKSLKPFVDFGKENENVIFYEDIVYHPIVFDKNFKTLAQYKAIQNRVIIGDSSSKDISDTAARVSNLVIPDELKEVRDGVLTLVNYYMSSGPTTECLKLIPSLSKKGDEEIKKRAILYEKKKDTVVKAFNEIGIDTNNPGGAFYLMVEVPEGVTASQFAQLAAEKAGVTFLPARYFGSWQNNDGSYMVRNPKGEALYPKDLAERYVRVAYVGEEKKMGKAIRRMEPMMQEIRGRKVA